MPRTPSDLTPSPFLQMSFAGGINTSVPQDRLADNEAYDILNFRFDDHDALLPRGGNTARLSQISAANITTRITSVYSALYQNGTIRDIFTTGSNIYTHTGGTATSIKGALSLPSDTFWMWKMYGDLAIGVNRSQSVDNPVKVSNAGNAALLGGSAPRGKFIEVWNDRVWITGANDATRNVLYGSKLGDPEDWTTIGLSDGAVQIEIEPDDGDFITGIIAFRGRLFVFKRRKIYVVQAIGGAAPTDVTALSVELYSQNIGALSGYSIQPVLDDVLFLSDHGVASLIASERVGDFNSALMSKKVSAFRTLQSAKSTIDYEISAYVVPQHNQYWIQLPASLSIYELVFDVTKDVAYVLDYARLQEGLVRWSRYDGAAAGSVMCTRRNTATAYPSLWIGGRIDENATTYHIWEYDLSFATNMTDIAGVTETAVNFRLLTKAYDFGYPFNRKELSRFMFDIIRVGESLTGDKTVTVEYYFDSDRDTVGSFTLTIPNKSSIADRVAYKADRKPRYNSRGARGSTVTMEIDYAVVRKGFGINSIGFMYSLLPEKKIFK